MRSRPLALVVVGAVAMTAAVVATRDPDPPEPVVVDERRGVLNGVRFGATSADVRARRGEPTDDYQGFFPRGVSYTGPIGIPSPPTDRLPTRMATPMHYEDSSYLVSPTVGVFSMATTVAGARTRAGVGVGDDLGLVRDRYRRVGCGEFDNGEGHSYAWCRALVGDVRVFFGADPIESITVTSYR